MSTPEPRARLWTPSAPRCITPQELDEFTSRQMQFTQHKKSRVEQLEHQVYGSGKSDTLTVSPEHLDKSCSRQCNEELQRREERRKRLEDKYAPAGPKIVTLDSDSIEAMSKRLQDDATRSQEKKKKSIDLAQKAIRDDACKVEKGRKITRSEVHSMGDRLCQPKKQLSYEETQKKIFGANVVIPEGFKEKAQKMREEEERRREQKKKH